ncbi:MAG TPA: hypothetical protein VII84_07465 [Acidimicrobiales bacterium]
MRVRTVLLAIGVAAVGAAATYLSVGRKPCLTWGSTELDAKRAMSGDELLDDPDILSTRAISIDALPSAIWPWLIQMGSGKGGVYTYDWIENLFGLKMRSANEILPQFQNLQVGDVEPLGKKGPRLRVAILEKERALVLHSEDGNWVWAFGLYPTSGGRTSLVSRNRIALHGASVFTRLAYVLIMEPGSLIMERKMLLGIKQRAEGLVAREGVASVDDARSNVEAD